MTVLGRLLWSANWRLANHVDVGYMDVAGAVFEKTVPATISTSMPLSDKLFPEILNHRIWNRRERKGIFVFSE